VYPSVLEFVERMLTAEQVKGADVLEVGSFDVNGSARPYLESLHPRRYLGVDAQHGPSVDRVVDCENLTKEIAGQWDVVISTEMLEHVRDWQTCIEQLSEMVKPGGLLLITTCSPGFPYHPFPEDHWRFTDQELDEILTAVDFEVLELEIDSLNLGVFTLSRKPGGWSSPADHRANWAALNIAKPTI